MKKLCLSFLLCVVLAGCEKETIEPKAPVKCWECEVIKSMPSPNGMAGYSDKTTASYCDRTAAEIAQLEATGTGTREVLEYGQVVKFYLSTKCKSK